MSKYNIRKINRNDEKDYRLWKNGLERFMGATIFHDPNFLSYHKDKFDEHHLGIFKGNELFGVIPFAFIVEKNKLVAKSPYGASYGGAIFSKILSYNESSNIIKEIILYLKEKKVDQIIITPPISIYYKGFTDTFVFSMLEQKFKCINSDITSVVTLEQENKTKFNTRAKRALKKAEQQDFKVILKAGIEDFWLLVDKTFSKHGVAATHSKQEFKFLVDNLNESIYISIVYFENKPIAGIANFIINEDVMMSFYICQDDEYKELNAQTFLISHILDQAYKEGYKYYDFGTSSVNMKARPNIFSFKEGLGAYGVFRHTYQKNIQGN